MKFKNPHEKYLEQHKDEYPFPLNGTDWARLVALHKTIDHHKECKCSPCKDFFDVMHEGGLKEHEHESARRAIKYWFWLGKQNGYATDTYVPEKTSREESLELLARLSADPVLLAETEKKWLKFKMKMFTDKDEVERSEKQPYWNESAAEMWESRPNPESRRIYGPTEVEEYDEE
jgi:hypothetical protein